MAAVAHQGIVTQAEIEASAMDKGSKQLALWHHKRMLDLVYGKPPRVRVGVGSCTSRTMAREHLARMTLVVRDYAKGGGGAHVSSENVVESMGADVLEACLSVGDSQRYGRFVGPVFCHAGLVGREQEVHTLAQELAAEGGDDVTELWNALELDYWEREDVVIGMGKHFGQGEVEVEDWDKVLTCSRSEDNLTHHRRDVVLSDSRAREAWKRRILERQREDLDRKWPLVVDDRRRPVKAAGFSRRGSHESMSQWQAD